MVIFNTKKDALGKLISNMPIDRLRDENWIVISLSEGGSYFAEALSHKINGKFEYLFSQTIVAPNNKECPVAVVSETEEIVINKELIDSFEIELDYIYGEAKRNHDEIILADMYKYRKGEKLSDLKGKNILLVDEGADTGLTLMAALKTVMNMKVHKVAVAIPVVPKSVVAELSKIVDDVFFVNQVENYIHSKHYYGCQRESLIYCD